MNYYRSLLFATSVLSVDPIISIFYTQSSSKTSTQPLQHQQSKQQQTPIEKQQQLILDLKAEAEQFNNTDSFAKYSKYQRRITKEIAILDKMKIEPSQDIQQSQQQHQTEPQQKQQQSSQIQQWSNKMLVKMIFYLILLVISYFVDFEFNFNSELIYPFNWIGQQGTTFKMNSSLLFLLLNARP